MKRAALSIVAILLAASAAPAATLQILQPYDPTSATHGATLRTTALLASSSHWDPTFGDEQAVYSGFYGSLDQAPGTTGDFFRINLGSTAGLTDTFTLSVEGSTGLLDPIFYFIDVQGTGATVTVSPGGTTFTSNGDAVWNGNVLTVTNGYPNGRAFAAVQYDGPALPGRVFTFVFDYSAVPTSLQSDTIGIAVATPGVPEPAPLALLAAAGALLTRMARRWREAA